MIRLSLKYLLIRIDRGKKPHNQPNHQPNHQYGE